MVPSSRRLRFCVLMTILFSLLLLNFYVQLTLKNISVSSIRDDLQVKQYTGNVTFTPHISDILVTDMKTTQHEWPWGQFHGCENRTYDIDNYPDASVIITFYNVETIYNLLHTVHAVIQNSPPQLLKEIILVDDATTKDDLHYVLHHYVNMAFKDKLRIIKSPSNVGLIRARNMGFRAATGQVVVVMDSHMEPRPQWLEALLEHIVVDRRTTAVSMLDWMTKKDDGTWTYKHGPNTWKTYFDWELSFGFMDIPDEEREERRKRKDDTAPIVTPTMIGGIFAVRKDFLEEIGYYDDGLEGWGGENVEMTTKAWLCGGRVLNIPCSHVAHLEPGNRGYRGSEEWQKKIKKNFRRVTKLFGEHEKYFLQFSPKIRDIDPGNMSKSLRILSRCPRDTKWYFKNVFPELGIPDKDTLANGGIVNRKLGLCLDTVYSFSPKLVKCDPGNPAHQGWFLTTTGVIRIPSHIFITVSNAENSKTTLVNCISASKNKIDRWIHWKNGPVIDIKSRLCLEGEKGDIYLRHCNNTKEEQLWNFKFYTKDYDNYITGHMDVDENVEFKSEISDYVKKHLTFKDNFYKNA